jgi:hypothetical protein
MPKYKYKALEWKPQFIEVIETVNPTANEI